MTRQPTVPPQPASTTPCRLAFVGEAPGKDELSRSGCHTNLAKHIWPDAGWTDNRWKDSNIAAKLPRLPLVGGSGFVFNHILKAANIERLDCWVGNVFNEHPPDDDATDWVHDPAIFEPACARLEEELRAAEPTVIVAMGGTALRALTGDDRIAKMRGYAMVASQTVPGAKIIPTYHPAHVMRVWKTLPFVVGDLIKAQAEADRGPELVIPKREWWIEPHFGDLEKWANVLDNADEISIDIETGWGTITCIGFAPTRKRGICVPFADMRKPNKSYWSTPEEEVRAWQWVKARCENPVPKLGQNYGSYDAYWLLEQMGIRTMNYRDDTRLMHHALLPDAPKDLGFLGSVYTELPNWKGWNRSDKRDD